MPTTYKSNIKQKISLTSNNRTTTNCAVQPRVTSDDVIGESDGNGNGSEGVVAEAKS